MYPHHGPSPYHIRNLPAPASNPAPNNSLLREESLLDLPANPEHARTKKWSYWALVIVGFALAVDYSSTLMSIQPLYYLVNGRQSLYGLTFGSYDLASLIFAPVFGWWVDRTNRFKGATLLGVALNAVGNYIYGFTVLAGEWWLMLLARWAGECVARGGPGGCGGEMDWRGGTPPPPSVPLGPGVIFAREG